MELEETKCDEKIAVLIASETLGKGDDELGKKLIFNFISTLKEMEGQLFRIILLNGGVKLATDSSNVIEPLKDLENKGIKILVCQTCLNYFNLLNKKQVGETTNMLDIVTSLQLADKTINIT